MTLREHVSGLLSHLKGSSDSRKQRKHRHLRSLLLEHLEGRRLLAVVDLMTLGAQGTLFYGADAGDASGISVSSAGDVNGDGYDDMIIGALQADASANAKSNAGESYVVFGKASMPATLDLGTMSLSDGFRIFGSDIDDFSGSSVSGVGDVNGDGLDDLIVGASFGDALGNAKSYAGEAYLIFGAPTFAGNIDLSVPLGSAGVRIDGSDAFDQAGFSVSNAGDINGDGFNDLAIGANFAAAADNAKSQAGESYIVFGSASLPASIDLSALGAAGITIYGADADDQSGYSISGAGDVNGDGFDDLIIGAIGGDASGDAKTFAGESYIVFGGSVLPSTIDLAALGSAGVVIFGSDTNDESGFSVSGAGDINGDGFDDVIIGARYGDAAVNGKINAGESYVIYGAGSLPASIDLASLGSAGVVIYGVAAGNQSGFSVSGAGDVNADGYDDLIIGALEATASGRTTAGESYVLFGGPGLTSTIDLATLAAAGITIYGFGIGDKSGTSVRAAGDVNGDGFDDVIIGAFAADALGDAKSGAGESYVVFGSNAFTNSIASENLGTAGVNMINGTLAAELINGRDGNDTLVGGGGADVIIGGRGDDVIAISDNSFRRIVGGNGNDTLRLDGSGLTLDLTTISGTKLLGIETIDITGSGINTLTLDLDEVLNLSDTSNTLTVRRNGGDIVNRGPGWTQGSNQVIGPDEFQTYTQGAATLLIQLAKPIVTITSGNSVYNKTVYSATASIADADAPTPSLSFTYYSDAGGTTVISAPTDAGTYYVRAFSAANAANVAAESLIATFTISQKLLTATFASGGANKTYDSTTAASVPNASITLNGVEPGDTVTAVATGTFGNKNAGSNKPVTIGVVSLAGLSSSNYTIAQSGALTSDIAVATVSAINGITANHKAYDATTTAALVTSGASFTGKFGGDTLTVASATGNFVNANVGVGKTVNITGLVLGGVDASNYTLSSTTASTTANINAAVINRRVFYNGATAVGGAGATGFGASGTVGNSFAATGGNPPATAIDTKLPLLPGAASTFNNYTNTSFGLNGIVVDMGIPVGNTLTAADFSFATGETISAPGFTTLVGAALTAVNPQVTQYASGGINGSTRAKLTFNNNSLRNIWLKVTVLANANTGLAADNVFYFGNVVGDTNASVTSSRYTVNAIDTSGVRGNQSSVPNSVLVTNIYDFNKSGNVNSLDTGVVRTNQQTSGIVRVIGFAPSFLGFGEGDGAAPSIDSSMGTAGGSGEDGVAQPIALSSRTSNDTSLLIVGPQPKASQTSSEFVTKLNKSTVEDGELASLDAFFAALGGK